MEGVIGPLILAGLFVYQMFRKPTTREGAMPAWDEAARRLGGEYRTVGRRELHIDEHRLLLAGDDGPFVVEHETPRNGPLPPTRFRIASAALRGFSLRLARARTMPWWWLEASRGPLVATGEADFDEAVQVTGLPPARVSVCVDAEVRAAVVVTRGWALAVADGVLELESDRVVDRADDLIAAIELARLLLGAERRWRARWREAAVALGGSSAAAAAFEVVRGSVRVSIAPDVGGQRPVVRVRAARLPGPAQPASPAAEQEATALGALRCTLASDAVILELPGAEPDLPQLERAIPLVARLVQPAAGPYR